MAKINLFLEKNINKIFIYFLLISPFLDLLTSTMINVFKVNFNFITIIKMLFLFVLIYYVIFISKSKYKKKSIIYFIINFIYVIIFSLIIVKYKDTSVFMYEIKNLFRTFYFPNLLVCFFNINQDKKIKIENKTLFIIMITYIILIFVPTITKTGFNSYAYSKVGSVGWFNSTNEIGGILSILFPYFLLYLTNIKNKLLKILIFIITIATFFLIGSKVPILSLGIIFGILILKYIIAIIRKKEMKKIFVIVCLFLISIISSIVIIPKTAFYKNIVIHLEFLEIDSITDFYDVEIIDHFIFSQRITFLGITKDNYDSASVPEKLFGIGYIENYSTDLVRDKMIEMDYYDIFYRHGIIGFIIFFIPLITMTISILMKVKNNKFDNELLMMLISFGLIFVLALFSGHILVSPSVSILVVVIIILLSNKLEVKHENGLPNN